MIGLARHARAGGRASRCCVRRVAASVGAGADGGSASSPHTASFGYEDIPEHEKTARVGQVFQSVAPSYDLMNDLMSAGLHRLWKDRLVKELHPFAGMQHLDMAGGTGDVAFRVAEAIGAADAEAGALAPPSPAPPARGSVTVGDINPAMLAEGRKRAARLGEGRSELRWCVADAEELPFGDACMDGYTIAFGLRNVTRIDAALAEAFRVLKPGGRFLCLEFSHVVVPGLRDLYDAYSFNVIPALGQLVAADRASYKYLVESIRRFPQQDLLADMIRAEGFAGVGYSNLSGGIVALHTGFKLA